MSGSLVLLPLRLGLRATGLVVRGAREIVERVAGLAGLASDESRSPGFDSAPTAPPTRTEPPARPTQTQTAGEPPLNQSEAVDYDAPSEAEPPCTSTRAASWPAAAELRPGATAALQNQLLAALLMPLGGEAPGSARRSRAETGAHFRSR